MLFVSLGCAAPGSGNPAPFDLVGSLHNEPERRNKEKKKETRRIFLNVHKEAETERQDLAAEGQGNAASAFPFLWRRGSCVVAGTGLAPIGTLRKRKTGDAQDRTAARQETGDRRVMRARKQQDQDQNQEQGVECPGPPGLGLHNNKKAGRGCRNVAVAITTVLSKRPPREAERASSAQVLKCVDTAQLCA